LVHAIVYDNKCRLFWLKKLWSVNLKRSIDNGGFSVGAHVPTKNLKFKIPTG
jgi:hypothetical protein